MSHDQVLVYVWGSLRYASYPLRIRQSFLPVAMPAISPPYRGSVTELARRAGSITPTTESTKCIPPPTSPTHLRCSGASAGHPNVLETPRPPVDPVVYEDQPFLLPQVAEARLRA